MLKKIDSNQNRLVSALSLGVVLLISSACVVELNVAQVDSNNTNTNSESESSFSSKSIAFDGNKDQYLHCDPSFGFSERDSYSVSFWVKQDGVRYQAFDSNGFFGAEHAPSNHRSWMSFDYQPSTEEIRVALISDFIRTDYIMVKGAGFPVDAWTHVVGTYDGSAEVRGLKLFVNGVEVRSSTEGAARLGGTVSHANPTWIGSNNQADGEYFGGYLDEVAIFSSALSDADVSAIYNSGKPGDLQDGSLSDAARLTHWWRMGEMTNDSGILPDQVGASKCQFSNDGGVGNAMTTDSSITSEVP